MEQFRVVFLHGEGSSTYQQMYAYGLVPEPPTPAEVTGKTFDHWDPTIVAVVSNTAYWARYVYTDYTITYLNGDGTEFTNFTAGVQIPVQYTYENAVTLPSGGAIDWSGIAGSEFVGWTNSEGTVVAGWPAGGLTGNQTFYAKTKAVVLEKYDAGSTTACADAEAAAELADAINAAPLTYINVPSVVENDAAYVALFEATVSGNSVTIDFTDDAAAYQQTNVTANAARAIPVAAAAEAATAFAPTGLTPGLWYSIVSGSAVTTIDTEGARAQAKADGTLGNGVTLTVPHPSADGGFFRIKASAVDKPAPEPN